MKAMGQALPKPALRSYLGEDARELAAMGVVIKDSKEGTTWEIAR